ncbi:hypothetical protein ZHAS_00020493 [Anopheles sinensis]|uniref:Uncharacterized protein n=1 Tax=Anopheles sinensis TaxID=74873 RepID=A0A084WPM1_ANOSI|nr:hypothetical protein ZHAS_00020493 [Anopheles sinensis]
MGVPAAVSVLEVTLLQTSLTCQSNHQRRVLLGAGAYEVALERFGTLKCIWHPLLGLSTWRK